MVAPEIVDSLGSAYWATTAQIVPVLAIPLVFEARLIARRLTQSEESFNQRLGRAGWGLLFSALGISMLSLEIVALSAIPFGVITPFGFWFSVVVIVTTLFTVFAIPLAGIANNFLTDVAWILRARLPWGALKRNRRRLRSLLDRLQAQVRQSRNQRLQLKMGLAEAELMPSRVRALITAATPPAIAEDPALKRKWIEALGAATEFIPAPEELRDRYKTAVSEVDKTVMLGEFAVELARTSLDQLEELIETGATRAQVEELRLRTAKLADTVAMG